MIALPFQNAPAPPAGFKFRVLMNQYDEELQFTFVDDERDDELVKLGIARPRQTSIGDIGSPTGNRGTRHYLSHLDRWSHYVTRSLCYGRLEQNAIKTSVLTSEHPPSVFVWQPSSNRAASLTI